jgi:hypothetical protein
MRRHAEPGNGGGGIQTHGTPWAYSGSQDRLLRSLGHPTGCFANARRDGPNGSNGTMHGLLWHFGPSAQRGPRRHPEHTGTRKAGVSRGVSGLSGVSLGVSRLGPRMVVRAPCGSGYQSKSRATSSHGTERTPSAITWHRGRSWHSSQNQTTTSSDPSAVPAIGVLHHSQTLRHTGGSLGTRHTGGSPGAAAWPNALRKWVFGGTRKEARSPQIFAVRSKASSIILWFNSIAASSLGGRPEQPE